VSDCFECGRPASEKHHVVPRVLGGTKTIPICDECHGKVHSTNRMNISELTKAGLERARLAGKRLGGKPKYRKCIINVIKSLNGKKTPLREIARITNIPYSTVRSILEREVGEGRSDEES